ncbi:hypothetical protein [Streptomyces sp. NPDC020917]|uniref:hypothetical protein n=1 Tax=Streptomyces sp. NPDC020917 TaxID=3365102 RepID=UPI00379CA23E
MTGEDTRDPAPADRRLRPGERLVVVLLSVATCAAAFLAVALFMPAVGHGKARPVALPDPYTTPADTWSLPQERLAPPRPFTGFTGDWYNHTGGLHVDAHLDFVLKTDVYCSKTETCAKRPGPTLHGTLTPGARGHATATVTGSSDPGARYPKSVSVTYQPDYDSLKLGALGEFCGAHAPPGHCGA